LVAQGRVLYGATGSAGVAGFRPRPVIHSPASEGKERPGEAVFSLQIFRLVGRMTRAEVGRWTLYAPSRARCAS
jgi:hypothetical protein